MPSRRWQTSTRRIRTIRRTATSAANSRTRSAVCWCCGRTKGGEYHHTGVPKEQYRALTPASVLISGRLIDPVGGASHWFMVIDSASEEAEIIENAFGLDVEGANRLLKPQRSHAKSR